MQGSYACFIRAAHSLCAAGHTAGRVQPEGMHAQQDMLSFHTACHVRTWGTACGTRCAQNACRSISHPDSRPAQEARNSKALRARPCALQWARLGTQPAHAQHPARATGAPPGKQHVAGREIAVHLPRPHSVSPSRHATLHPLLRWNHAAQAERTAVPEVSHLPLTPISALRH